MATPPGDSPAPSASAQTSTAPSAAEWTIAFDGDCASMLTAAQLDSVLGPYATEDGAWLMERYPSLDPMSVPHPPEAEGTAGGLSCSWMSAEYGSGAGGTFLTVLALPIDMVGPDTVAELTETQCEDVEITVCRLGSSANGLWVMASMPNQSEEVADVTATLRVAVAAALANAPAYARAVPAPRTAAWWPIVDCDTLGERMGLADLIGTDYSSGSGEGNRTRDVTVLEDAGVQQFCQYAADASGQDEAFSIISIDSQPGGAWRWESLANLGYEPTHVEGAAEAVRSSTAASENLPADRVVVSDRVNVMFVTVEGGAATPEAVAERALAALGR